MFTPFLFSGPSDGSLKRGTNLTSMLNAFMERQSLEAGDVTPAADAEKLQFDAETLRGEEKIPFFFYMI